MNVFQMENVVNERDRNRKYGQNTEKMRFFEKYGAACMWRFDKQVGSVLLTEIHKVYRSSSTHTYFFSFELKNKLQKQNNQK